MARKQIAKHSGRTNVKAYQEFSFVGKPRIQTTALRLPHKTHTPQRILVSYVGDIGDPNAPPEMLDIIVDTVRDVRRHTYILLTSNIENMYVRLENRPDVADYRNLVVAFSVRTQKDVERAQLIGKLNVRNTALYIKPIMEPLRLPLSLLKTPSLRFVELAGLAMGGSTVIGSKADTEQLVDALQQCQAAGVPSWISQYGTQVLLESPVRFPTQWLSITGRRLPVYPVYGSQFSEQQLQSAKLIGDDTVDAVAVVSTGHQWWLAPRIEHTESGQITHRIPSAVATRLLPVVDGKTYKAKQEV